MTRVLVCGARDYTNALLLFKILDDLHDEFNFTTVIQGEANGADTLARRWALGRQGLSVVGYPADWKKYGKTAGPIRNKQMLDKGKPDLVVAFPKGLLSDSRGTKNMVDQAAKAGVPVIVVNGEVLERLPVQYTIDEEQGPLA